MDVIKVQFEMTETLQRITVQASGSLLFIYGLVPSEATGVLTANADFLASGPKIPIL